MNTANQLVLVVVDCERFSARALETAAFLASEMRAELQCAFVEDERLLQAAELPFTREVLARNAAERQLTRHSLARALRGYSEQVRQALEAQAARHQLPFSFLTLSNGSLASLLNEAANANLLLFGDKPLGLPHRQADSAPRGSITAVVAGSDDGDDERTLRTAMALAQQEHCQLQVFLSPSTEQKLSSLLASYPGSLTLRSCQSLPLTSLAQDKQWRTLVLPMSLSTTDHSLINRLLMQSGRRLILVR